MPNDFFQFKHFRIGQAQCAMKVSTDACVLGAVAAVEGAQRILDVGTGTGLLALMAAQRNPAARIEAVEIDAAAAAQAARNVAASPWADRIQVHARSLTAYAATAPGRFDHILSNPPFFRRSLRSPDAQRTAARHAGADTLSFAELATFAAAHLSPTGRLTVLLPPPEMREFEREALQAGLGLRQQLIVHHRLGSKPLRHISSFGFGPQMVQSAELFIHDADEAYSAAFRQLLRDFYLAF
ncbi:methyltransferase domain-containing protein [Hymenobacter gummosus]|uniref:tRNA1(Val) (adenine(37)-N6)-methyltransferase n=1 Tax=Hymenobacter gummosus TaxID=1776032 RepID=A0A3S0H7S4_9BACT|nr:methyltransferase [Hymenobacter gummosus]RTQ52460.1 methyltransferase domain-containing protein [Hymenobacter gummosus]